MSNEPAIRRAEPPTPSLKDPTNEAERLRRLEQLREEGLISPEEYERKRDEILADL
jgi:hypothetical protein